MSQVHDARWVSTIFIAIGKKPQEIARRSQPILFQDFGTAGADALEELDGSVGRDHAVIVREGAAILRRVETMNDER